MHPHYKYGSFNISYRQSRSIPQGGTTGKLIILLSFDVFTDTNPTATNYYSVLLIILRIILLNT